LEFQRDNFEQFRKLIETVPRDSVLKHEGVQAG